jgi:glycosyltransferase involved in cell wall biosynthesis/SAM-dependent methyltransferase
MSKRRTAAGNAKPPAPPGSVIWYATFFNHSGYGEEARGFARAMAAAGWRVNATSVGDESKDFLGTPTLAFLARTCNAMPVPPVVAVVHLPASAAAPVGGAAATVARTMFETDGLPEGWVERLNTIDEVWVPSAFNVETFERAGVRVPIHIVPGGVDTRLYRPDSPPLPIEGTRGTVFLSIFEWSHRKAPDVLLRAWAEAFGPKDQVSLVLRCFPRAHFEGDATPHVEALIDEEVERFGGDRSQMAPIVVLGSPLAPASMPRLMTAADVFVGVSRGEGWGRPLLEAMACGRTVIGTRWSGNLDFMNDDNSLLVGIDGLSAIDDRMDLDFYRGQRWCEPSVEHLTELLRRAAADRSLRERVALQARADAERHWTWERAGAAAGARVRHLVRRARVASSTPGPSTQRLTVRWVGDFYGDSGFATVNRELCSHLAGADVGVEPATAAHPYPEDHAQVVERLLASSSRRPGAPVVEVRHEWPPRFERTTEGPLVIMQPWEFGGIPAEWLEGLAGVDEVWAPTTWVRDCFVRSGVPAEKVAVVPYGVDTEGFTPDGPRLALETDRTTRLLFVGGGIRRKGFDVLLDAYADCFGPDDDVCLVVKLFGSHGAYHAKALDERAKAMADDPAAPAVEVIGRRLTKQEIAELYRACDVLVHPYRGEGFGLPVAEAMASGLPTIVTNYGACLDFSDASTSWLLPATELSTRVDGIGESPIGYWLAQPDGAALRDALRDAVTDQNARKAKGAAARDRIVSELTWRHAADRARHRLLALAEGRAADRNGRGVVAAPAASEASAAPAARAARAAQQASADVPTAPKDLQERLGSLATLTTSALGAMQEALASALARVDQLEQMVNRLHQEASVLPGGGVPIPPDLVLTDGDGKPSLGFRGPSSGGGYRALEDVFRGPEETIRERQRFYLPHLAGRGPVLDVGCGRGEMLELLRAAGVPARGIDLDPTMAARARGKGLDVREGDLVEILSGIPDASLGAVFSAQVIEHLGSADLVAFFDTATRIIRPGGVLIVETVNPHCAIARKNFWIDTTHLHQIFPEVAVVFCRQAGFSEATVVFPGGSGALVDDLLQVPDYAVIAIR